ncbi:MAG TPA: alpha/beta hydrolase [Natronosporangium sp.]
MRGQRLIAGAIALLLPVVTGGWTAVFAAEPTPRATPAPQRTYPVGVRTLAFGRDGRPLPTVVWYPARSGSIGGAPHVDAPIAVGRFPLVLLSHGLHGLPTHLAPLAIRWAAAGFVVAAPTYPYTNLRATPFDRSDVRNQPADARRVIAQLSRLNEVAGDPFNGHLDPTRVAAAGHSAGGFTTAGLFTHGHSSRLRGGIVIAGGMRGRFGGPPAPLLFIHGGADPTVTLATGLDAYQRAPWPKGFLTLTGQRHGEYLIPGHPGFDEVIRTTTDFLRWTLYGDAAARARLSRGASSPGVATWFGRI